MAIAIAGCFLAFATRRLRRFSESRPEHRTDKENQGSIHKALLESANRLVRSSDRSERWQLTVEAALQITGGSFALIASLDNNKELQVHTSVGVMREPERLYPQIQEVVQLVYEQHQAAVRSWEEHGGSFDNRLLVAALGVPIGNVESPEAILVTTTTRRGSSRQLKFSFKQKARFHMPNPALGRSFAQRYTTLLEQLVVFSQQRAITESDAVIPTKKIIDTSAQVNRETFQVSVPEMRNDRIWTDQLDQWIHQMRELDGWPSSGIRLLNPLAQELGFVRDQRKNLVRAFALRNIERLIKNSPPNRNSTTSCKPKAIFRDTRKITSIAFPQTKDHPELESEMLDLLDCYISETVADPFSFLATLEARSQPDLPSGNHERIRQRSHTNATASEQALRSPMEDIIQSTK